MFTGKSIEKEIVMQMNLSETCTPGVTNRYPESILICSDGSVIAGHGKEELSIVSWYPAFEMLEFYSGDRDGKINLDYYSETEPLIEYLNMNYLIAGPI